MIDFDDLNITYKDLAIGGKLVTGTLTVNEDNILTMDRDVFKETLLRQLVDAMLKYKLVEFTKVKNPTDFSTTFRVRCYLAPDDQVKLLRVQYASI
jgi:hypothetical protein